MLSLALKGLAAHKLRFVLTTVAVVLGVAFVAGSFMLTDTIERSFRNVFATAAGGVDLTVRPHGDTGLFAASGQAYGVDPAVRDELAALDGVDVASPAVSGVVQLIAPDGQPVGGMGAPTLGINAPADVRIGALDVRAGRLPERAGEVAIDAYTAQAHGFAPGDSVQYVAGGPAEHAQLVGVVGFGEADNLAGATVTLFDLDTALERFSPDGSYDAVELIAADVAVDDLAARVETVVGDAYEVVTAEQIVVEGTAEIAEFLGIFRTALLVFAAVALFVGAFIIVNTFSIVLAQRARELALLRAVGASRAQVLRSVLVEAVGVGLVAGLLGAAAGAGLALGLRALLDALGLGLPADGLVLQARTVLVAVAVGLIVTTLAALAPALRASRVAPVQALQEAASPAARRGWVRLAGGALLTAAGVVVLAAGLFADAGLGSIGAGAALLFCGLAFLSPLVVRPAGRVLGWPLARILGVRGELARENTIRAPRRTAATASALMVGVALVGFVTIFAASMSASISEAVERVYRLDFDVRSTTFGPVPDGVAADLEALDETEHAVAQRFAIIDSDERETFAVALAPEELGVLYAVEAVTGAIADLADGRVIISDSFADQRDLAVGDPLQARVNGSQTTLQVAAVYDGRSIDVNVIIHPDTYRAHVRDEQVFAVGVVLADGVDTDRGQTALDAALAPYPTVAAMDRTAVQEQLSGQINQLLALVYGLLALAVVVAFFGIVNTLALSVFERQREIGLLRAVGMTRGQVRSMVRWESVLVAVLGAALGLAVGSAFGWLTVQAVQDQFDLRLVIPGGQLAAAVIIAALAGVIAGALPARRAARIDVLRAVTVE